MCGSESRPIGRCVPHGRSYRRDQVAARSVRRFHGFRYAGRRIAAWARIEASGGLGLIGTMLVFSAFPLANLLLGSPPRITASGTRSAWRCARAWTSIRGPRPAGSSRSCIRPRPRRCSASLSLLGPIGIADRAGGGQLGVVAGLHRAVGLAGGRARRAPASAGRDRAVALGHRADSQHLLAGPAQPDATGAGAGGVRLPSPIGREVAAGALVATAAAIKAFPILVLGYLVYRRMWKASVGDGGRAGRVAADRTAAVPDPGRRRSTTWSSGPEECSSPTTPTESPSARSGRTATRTSRSWP